MLRLSPKEKWSDSDDVRRAAYVMAQEVLENSATVEFNHMGQLMSPSGQYETRLSTHGHWRTQRQFAMSTFAVED